MKIKPVKKRRSVKYPTLAENGNLRSFLSANIPARWRNSRMASIVVTALLLLSELGKSKGYATESDTTKQSVELKKKTVQQPRGNSLFSRTPAVAPIFVHGEGRGVAGCVVLAPPVFISEDEAREIIKAEFAKYGVEFEEQDVKLKDGVYLDGLSRKLGIGFVFASTADDERWEWKQPPYSSVKKYDIRRIAEKLRRQLSHNDECLAAIFYDPMPRALNAVRCHGDDYEAYLNARESGRIDLHTRAQTMIQWQVQDFVAWLTCNGYFELRKTVE